jgi:hypothetical protein
MKPRAIPFVDAAEPGSPWAELAEPDWFTGTVTFGLLRPQCLDTAEVLKTVCMIIWDQSQADVDRTNYAFNKAPPTHELLSHFEVGSSQWFRAAWSLLTQRDIHEVEGWADFEGNFEDWMRWSDHLRISRGDVLDRALGMDWPFREFALPEAKQNPVWTFPVAMAWIATRGYFALARMGVFYKGDPDTVLVEDGVCGAATRALGWLQTRLAILQCECGAFVEFGWDSARHCSCLSVAWEELVSFNGGLNEETPELIYSADEGWVSMTWPDGADRLRFLRRDIVERWPAVSESHGPSCAAESSMAKAEQECKKWLVQEFAADPELRRSKADFRRAAIANFRGRLSERGFNHRVWPNLAREHGRTDAGAKKKS